jgi:hypothetical protein
MPAESFAYKSLLLKPATIEPSDLEMFVQLAHDLAQFLIILAQEDDEAEPIPLAQLTVNQPQSVKLTLQANDNFVWRLDIHNSRNPYFLDYAKTVESPLFNHQLESARPKLETLTQEIIKRQTSQIK